MKNKRYILIGLAFVLAVVAALLMYRYINDLKEFPSLSSEDEFIVAPVPITGGGFPMCGTEKITRKSDNLHIVTLSLCEDNIDIVSVKDGWFIVETTAGRMYRRNIRTGFEEIPRCTSCPPGSLDKGR